MVLHMRPGRKHTLLLQDFLSDRHFELTLDFKIVPHCHTSVNQCNIRSNLSKNWNHQMKLGIRRRFHRVLNLSHSPKQIQNFPEGRLLLKLCRCVYPLLQRCKGVNCVHVALFSDVGGHMRSGLQEALDHAKF